MNVTLALTAIYHGAIVLNYTEVVDLIKERDPKSGHETLKGAIIRDTLTGETIKVRAKTVINATGPFCGNAHLRYYYWLIFLKNSHFHSDAYAFIS